MNEMSTALPIDWSDWWETGICASTWAERRARKWRANSTTVSKSRNSSGFTIERSKSGSSRSRILNRLPESSGGRRSVDSLNPHALLTRGRAGDDRYGTRRELKDFSDERHQRFVRRPVNWRRLQPNQPRLAAHSRHHGSPRARNNANLQDRFRHG